MPENPRLYRSRNAPGTPKQGDIQYNEANNQLECYTGSAWGTITFNTANAASLAPTAGWVSLNTATPAWYVPAGAGTITGTVASLANLAAIGYNSTGRQLMIRSGG